MDLKIADPQKVMAAFCKSLKPISKMTVTQWASRFRILSPKDSNESGRYKIERVPYLKEIMDNLSSGSRYNEIIVSKGSQTAFTTAGINWIGYTMHIDPGPMLYVMPNKELLKKTSITRIDPMIESCEELKDVVADRDSRDGNTIFEKQFNDGFLSLGSSETPNTGRSTPFSKIFIDELSKFKKNIGNEGNWYKLLKGRTKTFKNSYKIFAISTPGIAGECPLTHEYEKTDKRRYYVNCVHCNHSQYLVWDNINWSKLPDGKPDLKTVHYECESCKKEILEHHKTKMLAGGKWKATEEPENPRMIGYHLSSLYSPVGWYSWADMVQDFYEAKNSKEEMITFINTALAEPYAERSDETPRWKSLYARREVYGARNIPQENCIVIATSDVQKNRIETGFFALVKRKEAHTCEIFALSQEVFFGDTSSDPNEKYYYDKTGEKHETPWYKLKETLLKRRYKWSGAKEHDNGIPVAAACLDTGFNTQTCYNFCMNMNIAYMLPIFGDPKKKRAINPSSSQEIQKNGRKMKNAIKTWPLGVSTLKEYVYQRLSLIVKDNDFPASYIHFGDSFSEESFKQLTAEDQVKQTDKNGYEKTTWKKNRKRNEMLDLTAYCLGLMEIKKYHKIPFENWNEACQNINETARQFLDSRS
jgi:phage terminase large subunit GpA-like protein